MNFVINFDLLRYIFCPTPLFPSPWFRLRCNDKIPNAELAYKNLVCFFFELVSGRRRRRRLTSWSQLSSAILWMISRLITILQGDALIFGSELFLLARLCRILVCVCVCVWTVASSNLGFSLARCVSFSAFDITFCCQCWPYLGPPPPIGGAERQKRYCRDCCRPGEMGLIVYGRQWLRRCGLRNPEKVKKRGMKFKELSVGVDGSIPLPPWGNTWMEERLSYLWNNPN